MKFLFDQNLSPRLATLLAAEYAGSGHVRWFGLATASDPDVWAFAAANGYAVASKDGDFGQRAILYGHPRRWCGFGSATAQPCS